MKYISLQQALELVKDNYHISVSDGPMEPKDFLMNLHTIADKVKNVCVHMCLNQVEYPFFTDPASLKSFNIKSYFMTGPLRKAHKMGNHSFVPSHLRKIGEVMVYANHINMFVGGASMPDENGNLSLSLSNVYETLLLEKADIIVLEVNPNLPYIKGDVEINIKDVDYLVKADYDIIEVNEAPPSEKDRIIGNLISPYIKDGDCLQIGIGGIPNALTETLYDKKDLGIHTELIGPGIVRLVQQGVVNGSKKQYHTGQVVGAIAMGTREMYDYMRDNSEKFRLYSADYCNDTEIIRKNDNQISLNTTLEVDLTGQCCSEAIGTSMYSGTGGQSDTAIGSQKSKGGKSFIALYSTTMVTNANGEKEEVSKIVPTLKPGAPVSLSRNDINYLVTEYGVVDLKGCSIKERIPKIISIAHPKFRDWLTSEAKRLKYID